ncbi:protein HGV2-like [Diadema antillarum]|uniref:protein HGV2-like n=1 Tax=Diadema antillarum TaxID=105358 RepID=UPI003A83C2E0
MLTEEKEQQAGSSSATAEPEENGAQDIDAEALDLLGQGKRNLVVGDPPAAVQCLQEACELLAAKYGEMADECGEAYFRYGCALLELASMENGVLGNALQGVPNESADSDSDDDDNTGKEKPSTSNIESADGLEAKEREEVIQQVQEALEATCEKEESGKEKGGEEEEEKEKEKGEGDGENEEKMETDEGGDDKDESEKEDLKKEDTKQGTENKEKTGEETENGEKTEEKQDEAKGKEEKDAAKIDEEKKKKDIPNDGEKAPAVEGDVKKEVDGKDKEEEEKGEAKAEEGEAKGKKGDAETSAAKTDEKADDAKKEKKDDDEDAEPDTTEGGEKSDQKEDADDIPNFQLAWEMLELARVILSRNESEEFQLKVSQIHLKLGELGLETEQYVQSIVDFTSCLEIQKKYLDPESRLLAGTHYNLGLAYTFAQKYDRSIEHYNLSKQLIEARLATLEKRVSEAEGKGKEKANEDDPLFKDQKEVDELKELLPDIVSKLEDAKEMKLQGPVGGESSDGAGPSTSSSSGFAPSSSSSAPIQQIAVRRAGGEKVQDASHLVKRKRKPEEGDAEPGTSAETKRSRQEEEEENVTKDTKADSSGEKEKAAVNGAGDAAIANGNGQTNGDTNGETLTNGDGKLSPEKPSEIKTKKLPTEDSAAAMETA